MDFYIIKYDKFLKIKYEQRINFIICKFASLLKYFDFVIKFSLKNNYFIFIKKFLFFFFFFFFFYLFL